MKKSGFFVLFYVKSGEKEVFREEDDEKGALAMVKGRL